MNRKDLIAQFRSDVDDAKEPFLWDADDVQAYLDDAIAEACDRARLIRDSTTPEVCEITVTAGTSTYDLHESILSVELGQLQSQRLPLELSSTLAMETMASPFFSRGRNAYGSWTNFGQSWRTRTGTPRVLVLDRAGKRFSGRLSPIPTANDVLQLEVFRGALESLKDDKCEPEGVPLRLHLRLVDWMKHLAYLKQDTETRDEEKSKMFAALFASAFGDRVDANVRRMQEDRRPKVVAFQEF